MEHTIVTLETLGGGAAAEKFQDELNKVIENILDINTTQAERSITLTVKMKPDESRQVCVTKVICSSKIAPARTFETALWVGKGVDGKVEAVEPNPGNKESLNGFSNVTGLKSKEGGK